MAFLGSILRSRCGDFNLFLIAALVALLVLPGASHAAIPPQSAEAVLLWLHSESIAAEVTAPLAKSSELLAFSHQKAEKTPQTPAETQFSAATSHCGQYREFPTLQLNLERRIAPITLELERHALAHLSGVRTNRRLN